MSLDARLVAGLDDDERRLLRILLTQALESLRRIHVDIERIDGDS